MNIKCMPKCNVGNDTIQSQLWYRQGTQSSSFDRSSSHNPNKQTDPAVHPVVKWGGKYMCVCLCVSMIERQTDALNKVKKKVLNP